MEQQVRIMEQGGTFLIETRRIIIIVLRELDESQIFLIIIIFYCSWPLRND